jgi:hypothetical protein
MFSFCSNMTPPTALDLEALAAAQLADLAELRGIGMELARKAGAEALAASDDEAEPSQRFVRLSRTVRQTILLERQVVAGAAKPPLWRRKAQVSDVAVSLFETEPRERRTGLLSLLDARIDQEADRDPDFANLPIGVLVARICRELGVTPDWALWADTDWAKAEAQDQTPGSPFAARPRRTDPLRPRQLSVRPRRELPS